MSFEDSAELLRRRVPGRWGLVLLVGCLGADCCNSIDVHGASAATPARPLLRRGIRASAPVASARLSLRGGKSDAAEVTRGAGNTTKTWEDKDQDSRSDDDDSKEWDYGKFGMTKPVVEDGQNLNADMTGGEGEPSYIGADQYIGKWGWTGLHRAACEGDARTLGKMLEMGGDANVATHNGWTPLIEAASEGHTECVQLLAKFGANVSLANKGGWTPLHFAVGNGHLETIRVLLALGANALCQDSYGDYPMDKALRNWDMDWPTLPQRCNVTMSVSDRKAHYWAAANEVNVSGLSQDLLHYRANMSRFSLYAPLLPGRRYSYDLDFEGEDEEHEDGTADVFEAQAQYFADDKDFVDLDAARENSAKSYNGTAINLELMAFLEQDKEVQLPPTSHANGILDEEVEDILSRWKDEEYEKRLAQGIPCSDKSAAPAPSPAGEMQEEEEADRSGGDG